jgi:hypothetical protein
MPAREYAVDGDEGFIGLNSRDNPVNLGKNFVSKAQNIRMDRGVASVRKGAERLTTGALVGQPIYGTCTYTQADGTELIILVVSDGLYSYNPDTAALSAKVSFPAGQTIVATDEVELYQAQGIGYVYILRGFSKSVLRWDGSLTIVAPGPGSHTNYPNSRHAIYYGNRHIVQTDSNTISVSHYLRDNAWSNLDVFTINDGSSDTLVAIAPWTLNEFVIFMRNSIFYAAAGVGANAAGDQAQESDSYIKSLASDVGCIAKGSIVQAGGGIIFLSDNGVYILNPAGAGNGSANTPEGMRLLTIAEPLSAPISDVIARINFNAVGKAVATYFENRYYLAVPLDGSEYNNAILVYNFINKAWESVDTYPVNASIENDVLYDFDTFAIGGSGPYAQNSASMEAVGYINVMLTEQFGAYHGLQFGDKVNLRFVSNFDGQSPPLPPGSLPPFPDGTYEVFNHQYLIDNPGLELQSFFIRVPYTEDLYTPDAWWVPYSYHTWQGSFTGAKAADMTFMDFVVAKKGNRRRMFMVNDKQGLFLLDELDYDEFGQASGTPVLPFYIPATLSPLEFTPINIDAELVTRAYSFQTNKEKRFSSFQVDAELPAGGVVDVFFDTTNPDTSTKITSYGSDVAEDFMLRVPARKSGYHSQLRFKTKNLRPAIRSVTVEAVIPGQMTQTKK